jgi:flagellar hook protein FlgE
MMKTSLTGVIAASRDLSVISNNLANAKTAGFKRSIAQFAEVRSTSEGARSGVEAGSGALTLDIRRNNTQGGLTNTESALDVAISGSGYLVFGEANGVPGEMDMTYSRAGKLTLNKDGAIVDSAGNPLLGFPVLTGNMIGGQPAPINLSAAAGGKPGNIQTVSIDGKGVINITLANGRSVQGGAIALATFRNDDGLKNVTGAKLKATDTSGQAELVPAGRNGMGDIRQGTLEDANVDITSELMSMVKAQQAYNGNARALQTNSEMIRSAVDTLVR